MAREVTIDYTNWRGERRNTTDFGDARKAVAKFRSKNK
jgi:hypothetical protein